MIRPAYINSPSAPPLNLCSVLYLLCATAPDASSTVIAISSRATPWNQGSFLHFILPPHPSTRLLLCRHPEQREGSAVLAHPQAYSLTEGWPKPFFGLSGALPPTA